MRALLNLDDDLILTEFNEIFFEDGLYISDYENDLVVNKKITKSEFDYYLPIILKTGYFDFRDFGIFQYDQDDDVQENI